MLETLTTDILCPEMILTPKSTETSISGVPFTKDELVKITSINSDLNSFSSQKISKNLSETKPYILYFRPEKFKLNLDKETPEGAINNSLLRALVLTKLFQSQPNQKYYGLQNGDSKGITQFTEEEVLSSSFEVSGCQESVCLVCGYKKGFIILQGKWSIPVKTLVPSLQHAPFQVGDYIVVKERGYGVKDSYIGFFTQITEIKEKVYCGGFGIKTNPIIPDSNQDSGYHQGYIGAKSFKKATPEDFLIEAQKRYPKGTVLGFNPDYPMDYSPIRNPSIFSVHKASKDHFLIHAEPGNGVLYCSKVGKWTPIKTPVPFLQQVRQPITDVMYSGPKEGPGKEIKPKEQDIVFITKGKKKPQTLRIKLEHDLEVNF